MNENPIEKKEWIVGDKTKTHATITEEERNPKSIHGIAAKDYIEKAAKINMPDGAEYLGSACVHFFSKDRLDSQIPAYMAIEHITGIQKLTEHHADFGMKQLKLKMMDCFGKKAPKERA